MQNIRQSEKYAEFMMALGWNVEKLKTSNLKLLTRIYIRQFPLIGSFIKILHIQEPIPYDEIDKIANKYRTFKIHIQPNNKVTSNKLSYGYKLSNNTYGPTKTIHIDLRPDPDKIYNSFSPEKRRAVRKAVKNKITVHVSEDIKSFIDLKNSQLWPFGFLLLGEIEKLWNVFQSVDKAILLLAHTSSVREIKKPVAGVLLLFHDNVAYYWLASSTKEGNKLFAPSLLVWEALKISKKKGNKIFDFEGVEDKRYPQTKNWAGFSRFKNGFGGKEITFASPLQKLFWPTL